MAEAEGPRPATGAQQDAHWKELVVFWVENLAKLALPIVTAIVALAGTYLTTSINEQNNLRDTINQREQAESALRTSMFRELVPRGREYGRDSTSRSGWRFWPTAR